MAHFIVTGVAGFIGAAVAKKLIQSGGKVVGIDNLSTGFMSNIPNGVEFIKAHCHDPSLYGDRIARSRFDAIFHIAGQSSGEISFDDPGYDLRTNAESTLHLLTFARETGCKRMIYASTMSVYGIQPDAPVSETAPAVPQSFYGVGKIASEHYLRLYEQFGIASTALRLFNVYGPGQNLENLRQGMVSIFLAQMINNNKVIVKGDLNRFRDFIHIEDVVAGFLLCLKEEKTRGKVFNVGTGVRSTVGELLDQMMQSYRNVPVEVKGTTSGDIFGLVADVSYFREVAGFQACVSLKKGLKNMFDWALNTKNQKKDDGHA